VGWRVGGRRLKEEEKWKKEQEKQHRGREITSDQSHLVILSWT
jgi:hypothetical protein